MNELKNDDGLCVLQVTSVYVLVYLNTTAYKILHRFTATAACTPLYQMVTLY